MTRKFSFGDIIHPFDSNEHNIGKINYFFLLKPLSNILMHKEQGKGHKVMPMT
jgi:hypothetical protein